MEWVETTGTSVEEAKDAALDALGVHEDDAEFDIVDEGKAGILGFGRQQARVRARVKPSIPRAKEDRRRRRGGKGRGGQDARGNAKNNNTTKSSGGQTRKKAGESSGGSQQQNQSKKPKNTGNRSAKAERKQEPVTDEPTMPLSEQADIADEFLVGLAQAFGTTVTTSREDLSETEIRITATGENIGRMIGQRGNTAYAIDELVRTVLQRHAGSSRDGRVRVDMGGVRARRAEALAAFVSEKAETVRTSGVSVALEPMGGADRKVVHDTIANEAGVSTISEGEDPNRRVVLVPAGDAD